MSPQSPKYPAEKKRAGRKNKSGKPYMSDTSVNSPTAQVILLLLSLAPMTAAAISVNSQGEFTANQVRQVLWRLERIGAVERMPVQPKSEIVWRLPKCEPSSTSAAS